MINWITILLSIMILLITSCNLDSEDICNCEDLKSSNNIKLLKDTPFSGTCKNYYKNGNLQSTTEYSNGIMNGWYTSFYSDSTLKSRVKHENGFRRGIYEYYDSLPNLLVTKFEFIRPPLVVQQGSKKEDEYKWNGFVNREWRFQSEDTSVVSVSSNIYSIKPIEDGIKIFYHFDNEYSTKDTSYIWCDIIIGDFDLTDSNFDTTRVGVINKRNYFEYHFNDLDVKNGFVKGMIRGCSIYANKDPKTKVNSPFQGSAKDLFFNWSIKEGRLDNY